MQIVGTKNSNPNNPIPGQAYTEALKTELRGYARTAYGAGSWYQRRHDRNIQALYAERFATTVSAMTDYSRSAEDYLVESLENLKGTMLTTLSHAQEAQRQVKEREWDLVMRDFDTQMKEWAAQMGIIIRKSGEEWTEAEGRINREYFAWRENFAKTYAERDEAWRESYMAFLEDKDDWMTEQYLYAANYANYGILKESGADVQTVIARSLSAAQDTSRLSLRDQGFDADGYIDRMLADTNLAGLMDYAGSLNGRIAGSAGVVQRGIKRNADTSSLIAAQKALEGISTDRRAVASRLAAAAAQKQLTEMRKSYRERLMAENKGMKDWEISMVQNNGYTVKGEYISREMIVGSTVVKNIKNKQTVHMYEDFRTADAVISVRLDDAGLEGIDDYGIMMLVAQAQRDMQAWSDDVFGRTDEKGYTLNLDIPRNPDEVDGKENAGVKRMKELGEKEEMSEGEREEYYDLSVKYVSLRDGKLGRHIGYAPVFKQEDALDLEQGRESNVASAGIGEMGRIMLDFQWNSIVAGKGMKELALPMYDKRIWDDTGSWFKAPTVRSVTDMAMSIVGAAVGLVAGPVASSAIGMIDDVMFGGLDLGGGYKTVQEVGLELGKLVVTSALNIGVGALFSGMGQIADSGVGQTVIDSGTQVQTGNFLNDGGINGLITASNTSAATKIALQAASSVGQAALTTVANTAINSFEIKNGSLSFNSKSFTSAMGSTATWASVAAAGAGTFTAGALGQMNLGSNFEKVLGFNSGQIGSIGDFNKFAGSMVGAGVTYGMTGNVTFNVAKASGVGLLEMNLGKDGFSMGLGMGGTDISYGTIANAMNGLSNWGKNIQIEAAAKRNDNMTKTATALRTQWGYGDEEAKALLDSILNGDTILERGNGGEGAKTEIRDDGKRVVTLNGYSDDMTTGEQLAMGATLQWEAHRDGVVTRDNYLETREAFKASTEMAQRMLAAGLNVDTSGYLGANLAAYAYAKSRGDMSLLDMFADTFYRSDGDYQDFFIPFPTLDDFFDFFKQTSAIGKIIGLMERSDAGDVNASNHLNSLWNDARTAEIPLENGSIDLTLLYTENILRTQAKINKGGKEGTIGYFGKISLLHADAKISLWNNDDASINIKGVGDVLTVTGQGGLTYKNGFSLGVAGKASLLSGRGVAEINSHGYRVEMGATGDIGSIGGRFGIYLPSTERYALPDNKNYSGSLLFRVEKKK
ncbi:hypothetical protein AGMMS49942_28570 [Spirochaetia bacterium]|nr:hypothetical protein AGMMS49942_28570 [Spirochaetia bacterium]